ncbi:MAG TPA: LPS export ABC transporter periplasmic protein LptC [Candidatus Odoribacter faecigallinarum]|uniref:LPS export ABC transporter periplasmic protein LptC n=1 Tax=Candidatus Odoribacter faecigallinarum TaxID=2838706 RepID=A0A9D1V0J7_9BACT|nr:LPS export ABC transporter periplasmic protein LptC [Candidatus Odoribacter faecigallinarum]
MRSVFSKIIRLKSITALMGAVMLFSCKNDMEEINRVAGDEILPEMTGTNLEMIYTDSARIKYKVITPEYLKMSEGEEKYEEFPQGLHAISYDTDGKEIGSITCKYAKKLEDEQLWEARNEVVVVNAEGKKLETELLYWDTQKQIIYSDRYAKLSADGQIIEGNRGFKSDQDLKSPIFYGITGELEVEQRTSPDRPPRPEI